MNNSKLIELDEKQLYKIEGGILPLAVIAFAKGFAFGSSVAGTCLVAAKAIDKAINDITK